MESPEEVLCNLDGKHLRSVLKLELTALERLYLDNRCLERVPNVQSIWPEVGEPSDHILGVSEHARRMEEQILLPGGQQRSNLKQNQDISNNGINKG